jgi:hypothetical protein
VRELKREIRAQEGRLLTSQQQLETDRALFSYRRKTADPQEIELQELNFQQRAGQFQFVQDDIEDLRAELAELQHGSADARPS